MTRQEAKDALGQGQKVTHTSFTPQEWIKQQGVMIVTSDGHSISQELFWADRKHNGFNEGWSIKKV